MSVPLASHISTSRPAFIAPVPVSRYTAARSFVTAHSFAPRCASRRSPCLANFNHPPAMTATPTGQDPDPPTEPTNSLFPERIAIGVAWVGCIVVSFLFGPGDVNDSPEIFKIFNGNLADVNDAFFAIFNLVGVVVFNHIVLLYPASKGQKRVPFAPCAIVANFLGFTALAPYLFTRQHRNHLTLEDTQRGWFGRWLESRANAVLIALYALWAYAFALGVFTPGTLELHDLMFYSVIVDFGRLLQTDRFVFSTTLDCLLLSVSLWSPLTEDMRRRGWFCKGKEYESIFTALSVLSTPGLGPSLYLLLRPRLQEKEKAEEETA